MSQSVTGKQWIVSPANERLTLALMQRFSLDEIVARVMVNRGVTLEQAEHYLTPKLLYLMPDPLILLDMEKGIERIYHAIINSEKIAIFSDYDVDGATSSAILRRYFKKLGLETLLYIPDRIDEGYGPNVEAMSYLKTQGTQVIIMTDCGTTAFEPLEVAAEQCMDVVVLDHHTAQPKLPKAYALINPNRLDQEDNPLQTLCAAGLAFMFLVGLNRYLKKKKYFNEEDSIDLKEFLDLVALGTICDVMPLKGLNRAFVTQGLKVLRHKKNLGLSVLSDVSGVKDTLSTYHLGFMLGPRINAGGRVGRSDLGSRLLSTDNLVEAKEIAHQLNIYNQERKNLEQYALEQAIEQVEKQRLYNHALIMVHHKDWHPGVIGIVAGRLKEHYSKPACVVAFQDNIGKGSGRSLIGVDLGTAMHVAHHHGLLVYGGGHAMAAGFTVLEEKYEAFYAFLQDHFAEKCTKDALTLKADGYLSLRGVTVQLAQSLVKYLEPFGNGNATPKFIIDNVRIAHQKIFQDQHIMSTVRGQDGSSLKTMAFRAIQSPLGQLLLNHDHRPLDLFGSLKISEWMDKQEISFNVEDVRLSSNV